MFNTNNVVTISLKKYEELIRTSQKYEILYNIVFNKFKGILDDVYDMLENIDFEKFNETLESQKKNGRLYE